MSFQRFPNEEPPDGQVRNRRLDPKEIPFFVGMSVLCLLALFVLFFDHPSRYSLMPRCPFYMATGLYCPGCGSLRATHYLLHGDFVASLRHHPLFMPLLLGVFFLYGKRLYEFRSGTSVSFRGELLCYKILLAVFVLFFVVRNIPVSSLEWTRPPEPVVRNAEPEA